MRFFLEIANALPRLLNRLEAEREGRNPNNNQVARSQACLAVRRGIRTDDGTANWFAGKPEENFGLALASDTEAYRGRLGEAGKSTKRAVESAIQVDSKESGATWLANAALREAAFGNAAEARRAAAKALRLAPASQGTEAEAALAFAMAGEAAQAESLEQDLRQRFPLDTQMQSLWLPSIQMQLALSRKDLSYVLNATQSVSPIEYGTILFVANSSCLYPTYIRGEAHLAAGHGTQAAAEFQKVLDHSGLVWNC
jgi:tetratricopeptide (TPR) repeat protein